MKKGIKLYEATITNDDVKKLIRELKNSIKEHKKEKHSISAGMGMMWEEWDIFFEYFDNLQQAVKNTKETADDMLYELNEEKEELKSRIEKAVEYINGTTFFGLRSGKTFLSKYLNELLNILNGRSDK